MNIFWFRNLCFKLFCLLFRVWFLITGQKGKDYNYHKTFFRFLKIFIRKFTYRVGESKLNYDPVYSGIGWPIYFSGVFEQEELSICGRFLNRDSIVADIGANIGLHSVYFADIAKNGIIYAFEPSQFTFSFLLKNAKAKNNILPLNIGLSDTNGIFSFFDCENDALSGLKNTMRSSIRKESKVVCMRGDDFFNSLEFKKPDFIKIDVEGLEQEVIEGLQGTIKKNYPVIFCEIYKGLNSNNDPEKTVTYIASLGYKAFVMSNASLKPYVKHNDFEHNYFFIPENKISNYKLDF
jgi:FkbM family methyltransferase